jgi:hypothetical protein
MKLSKEELIKRKKKAERLVSMYSKKIEEIEQEENRIGFKYYNK